MSRSDVRAPMSAITASSRPADPPPVWPSLQGCLSNDPPDAPSSSRAGHETRATYPDQALKPALLLDAKIDDLPEPGTDGSNPSRSSEESGANSCRPQRDAYSVTLAALPTKFHRSDDYRS